MNISKTLAALALAAFIVAIPQGRAHAQTVALGVNDALSVDGLTFTVATCSYQANGVSRTCGGLNDDLEFVGSTRGAPTIDVIGNAGSAALSGSTSGGLTQLAFSLTITKTVANSNAAVTSFSNAITGSPSVSANVYSKMIYGAYNANTTLAAPSAGSATFTPANPMSVSLSLGLAAGSATTLILATDALHFSPAPEPASIALFATGVTGLFAIRRGNRKPRQPAR